MYIIFHTTKNNKAFFKKSLIGNGMSLNKDLSLIKSRYFKLSRNFLTPNAAAPMTKATSPPSKGTSCVSVAPPGGPCAFMSVDINNAHTIAIVPMALEIRFLEFFIIFEFIN
ncbi:MAG: hypothetical protein CMC05_15430 [Flavobacteriaceae bacterium]|nr:hypothetical protein [Flavobacteriaceae bacterium]